MYVAQYYTPDCRSEDNGEIIAKARTLEKLVDKIVNDNDLFEEYPKQKITYDDNYLYIGRRPCYKLQEI